MPEERGVCSPNWVSSHLCQRGLGPWWEVNQHSVSHPGVSSLQCLGACLHPLKTPVVTCPPVWHLLDPALALSRPIPPQDPLFAGLPSSSQAALSIKDGPNSCSVGLPICMSARKALHLLLLLLVLLLHSPVAGGSAGGEAIAAPEGTPGWQPRLGSRQTDDVCSQALYSCQERCVPFPSYPHPG